MRHQRRIEKAASQRAAELFNQHKITNTVLQDTEAIQMLAEEQATHLLQANPTLEPRQEVLHLYCAVFIEAYTLMLETFGETSEVEDFERDTR